MLDSASHFAGLMLCSQRLGLCVTELGRLNTKHAPLKQASMARCFNFMVELPDLLDCCFEVSLRRSLRRKFTDLYIFSRGTMNLGCLESILADHERSVLPVLWARGDSSVFAGPRLGRRLRPWRSLSTCSKITVFIAKLQGYALVTRINP